MTSQRVEAGAIILAAGLSTRFGGFPKALATFNGQTLLARAVECFQRCGLKQLTVVTGHRRGEVEAATAGLGARSVFNPDYQSGMFTSIQTGVRSLAGVESFFVLPVDAALIQSQTVLALLTTWRLGRGSSSSVLIPAFNDRPGH
ncbi:MAG: nucleotidyltransferase family protein, partial [Candidatus Adiutrix sp.]|nr:nucleotidyltransferase family protein [Candidatus Adiutrix sp.]